MTVTARNIDFSKVKDGGNFNKARVPAGDYLAKIIKIEDAPAKDETPQYLFTIQLVKRASSKLPYYCKLQENQLWKLRNILIAGGLSVPKSKQKVDPNRLLNKQIGVTIEDAEYEGKEQSEIAGVFPAAELGEADDDDEVADDDTSDDDGLEDDEDTEEVADEPEEEEAEEEAEEEPEEEEAEGDEWDAITDRLELRKALKKVAPDVTTSKAQSDDDIRDLIREAVAKAAKPVKKAAPAAKKAAPKKPIDEVSDEELEELDIDDL